MWDRGFPGLTANPQHTFGPSWSVRRMAAPRSMGPVVFLGSPPTHYTPKLPQYSAKGKTTQILGAKCQHKPICTRSKHSQTRATKNASETRAIPQKNNKYHTNPISQPNNTTTVTTQPHPGGPPQCSRHNTTKRRSSNSVQHLPMQVNHSVVFPSVESRPGAQEPHQCYC